MPSSHDEAFGGFRQLDSVDLRARIVGTDLLTTGIGKIAVAKSVTMLKPELKNLHIIDQVSEVDKGVEIGRLRTKCQVLGDTSLESPCPRTSQRASIQRSTGSQTKE